MILQDTVTATLANKEAKKKLSPTNAKALNTMRQRLKKHNIPYQEAIDKIKANPEIATESESEEVASSDSEESSDEEEVAAKGVSHLAKESSTLRLLKVSKSMSVESWYCKAKSYHGAASPLQKDLCKPFCGERSC